MPTPPLFNLPMPDGSRHFYSQPLVVYGAGLAAHLEKLAGVQITNVTDYPVDVWIDFEFRGCRFSVNNPTDEYWFFAEDPHCPDGVLLELAAHCEKLLREK